MISRRIATFLLGIWIGCCVLVDLLALQTGHSAKRFLDGPDTNGIVQKIGKDSLAPAMHHVALQQTRELLGNWELTQLGLAGAIAILLTLSDQKKQLAILMCGAMLVIVGAQTFLITPQWTDLGRQLDFAPSGSDPVAVNHMATLTQTYGALETLKLLLGGGLASYFFAMESTVRRRKRHHASSEIGEIPLKLS